MKRKILTMLIAFSMILSTFSMGGINSKASELEDLSGVATSTDAESTEATENTTDVIEGTTVEGTDAAVLGEAPDVTLQKRGNYYYYGEICYPSISFTNLSDKEYIISDYKGYYLFEDGTTKELEGQFYEQITPIDTIIGKTVAAYDAETASSGCYFSFHTKYISYKYLGASIIFEIEIEDAEGNAYSYYWDSGKVIEREDLFEYTLGTEDDIVAGETVRFELSIENIYNEQIVFTWISAEYMDDVSDNSSYKDLNCDVKYANGSYPVNDMGNEFTNGAGPIRVNPGEEIDMVITCTVPESYNLKSLFRVVAAAQIPNGGPNQMKTHSFLTNKVSCEELTDLVAGKEAKVRMYVTSSVDTYLDDVTLNFHKDFTWTAEAYENPTSQVPVTYSDEAGNAISDISKVAISAGETKVIDMSFTVPADWVEGSVLNVKSTIKDASAAASVSYYPLCYVEIFEDVNVAEGTPDVVIPSDDENSLGDSVDFSKEEIEKGAKGGKLEVQFRAGKVESDEVDSNELSEIKEKANDREIATIVDLSVNKYVNGEHQGKVDKLRKKVKITIDVPEEFRDNKREFTVIKMHNGVATELLDLDDNPNTVTFMTDEFSLYTMVYNEIAEDTTATTAATTTATGNEDNTTATTSTTATTAADNEDNTTATTATTQSNGQSDTNVEGPKTGDNMCLAMVFMLMLISGFATLIISRKKI